MPSELVQLGRPGRLRMTAQPASPPGRCLRKHNFSGGPGELPPSVLAEAARAVEDLDGSGISILGLSHRSARFEAVVEETVDNIRLLANVPPSYDVLLLQGGGTLQFSMASMHLGRPDRPAAFVSTGYWSQRAIEEALHTTDVAVVWSGRDGGFRRIPGDDEIDVPAGASFFHYVMNETVEGVQFQAYPAGTTYSASQTCRPTSSRVRIRSTRTPSSTRTRRRTSGRPASRSSSSTGTWSRTGRRTSRGCCSTARMPTWARSTTRAPVFAVYVVMLVTRWIIGEGGLEAVAARNAHKAELLYAAVDRSRGFYSPHAERSSRSVMNVTFRTPSPELDSRLVRFAEDEGFVGIAGHRSLGGIRVSNYNAVALDSVVELCGVLNHFARSHG